MLKNGLYNTIGGVSRTGISLLTIPLLIILIGLDEYGLWSLVFAIIGIITIIENGLSVATTVFLSRDLALNNPDEIAQIITISTVSAIVIATLVATPFWLWASLLIQLFPNLTTDQQIVAMHALQLSGFVVWIRLIQQVPVGIVQAYQHYGALNVISTVQVLFANIGLIIVAGLGGRTVEMMTWYATISFIIFTLFLVFTRSIIQPLRLRPRWNRVKSIAIIQYTTKTWLTMIGSAFFNQIDRIIVGAILGTRAVGIYAAITSITVQINNLSAMPVQPLLPVLGRLDGDSQKQPLEIQRKIKQAFQINSFVSLGVSISLFVAAPAILTLTGTRFISVEQVLIFQLAVLIYGIYSLNAVGYFILLGTKSINLCMVLVAISGITSLLLIYIGAATHGILGAILGNTGYILTLLLNVFGLRNLNLPFKAFFTWLKFPILWFICVITLYIILPKHPHINLTLVILADIILIWWFLNEQEINIQGLAQKLKHREP